MTELTLLRSHSPLSEASEQLRILSDTYESPSFAETLAEHHALPLRATGIRVLQINVGKLCNQTCRHCHVDAGPDRREIMPHDVAEAVIDVLRRTDIPTLDITGGAPEMNPSFRWMVQEARKLGRQVIDRCNLTILVTQGFDDLPEFLAEQQVEIVASLPCYLEENVDQQRGQFAFRRSIEALRRLNELGYGRAGSPLTLTLVFNPLGPQLPPDQTQLEAAYRRELRGRYGIEFTRLFTITNMPISRFLADLLESGQYESYLRTLVEAFNPAAVDGLMCRTTLSVDWLGNLYDCDFNQMLALPVDRHAPRHIRDFDAALLSNRPIVTGPHCYGCTAGAGSSCQGSLTFQRV
jgi:radical SAM/Cys-rich protein